MAATFMAVGRQALTDSQAMNRLERAMVYLIPVLLLAGEAMALAFDRSIAPHHALHPLNGQLLFTATAATIALMTTRRIEIGDLSGLTGLMAAVMLPVCYAFGARGLTLLSIFGECLWLASLLLAARAVVATRGEQRLQSLDLLVIRFSLPICLPLLQVMLWLQSRHLATVYDADARSVRFYLNGQFDKETRQEIAHPARLGPAQIGNWNRTDRKLSGRMDEFLLLGRALNNREIRELYLSGNPYH